MKLSDYVRTAFKNLFRQKLRTFLTIFAIVIGAISVTIMLSLVLAGRKAIVGSIEASGALKIISVLPNSEVDHGSDNLVTTSWNNDGKNKMDDTTVAKITNIQNVEATSPIISPSTVRSVFLEGQKKRFHSELIGIDPSKELFTLKFLAGRDLQPGDEGKVVLNDEMLGQFGYKGKPQELIGKKLMLVSNGGEVPAWAPDPPKPPMNGNWDEYQKELQGKEYTYPVEIIGVIQSVPGVSSNFITLDFARTLSKGKFWGFDQTEQDAFQKANDEFQRKNQEYQAKMNTYNSTCRPNMICKVQHPGQPPQQPQHPEMKLVVRDNTKDYGYGSIIIKAKSSGAVDEIAKSLEGLNLRPITAQAMIEQFSQIFTIIGAILGGIGGIALFVSAIGIINTMVMATYERTKEIGVLRACGAKRSTIRRLFTFEAALLGFFGGAIGLAVSYGIAQLGNLLLDQVATEQSLPLSGLITFPIWLIGGVIVFTTLIGTLAGLYPALRASRMDPITALRYE